MPFLWPRKVPMVEPSLTSQIYRTIKHHILKNYHLQNVLCHCYLDVVTVIIVVIYCFTEACFHFIQLRLTVNGNSTLYILFHSPLTFAVLSCEPVARSLSFGETVMEFMSCEMQGRTIIISLFQHP